MTEFIRICLLTMAAYGIVGLLFSIAFHRLGLTALDASAAGAGLGFRLLITPGIVALWPLLVWRWWRRRPGLTFPGEPDTPVSPLRLRTTHALAWKALAIAMPLVVALTLWWRPDKAPRTKLRVPVPEMPSR